nr:transposase [Sulfobacillus harzensis]
MVIHWRGAAALAAFQRFAETLRADWDAVVADISLPWSQGPLEGLSNRTKTLNRMMYGRARLPFLSSRILHR